MNEELLGVHPSRWFHRTSSPGAGKLSNGSRVLLMRERILIRLLDMINVEIGDGIYYYHVTRIGKKNPPKPE